MTEPLSPRAAAQAACPHLKTYEAIESVSQKLKLYCDDCGKNLTKPETGTVWDELARLREERDRLLCLAPVGRLYLDALDADPEHELLTFPQAFGVTLVREAVERWEADHG